MESKQYLDAFYESHDENARLLTRHGAVEYLTTMRYIGKYLRPGMRVLEIGAGTGRYSHALAQQGYRVDAVELVERNIQAFHQHTQPGEPATITQGDARDLSAFAINSFIDRVIVHAPQKVNGQRCVRIEVIFRFIGSFAVPTAQTQPTAEELEAEDRRAKERKRNHQKYLRRKERQKTSVHEQTAA